jgi:hypothetical protein
MALYKIPQISYVPEARNNTLNRTHKQLMSIANIWNLLEIFVEFYCGLKKTVLYFQDSNCYIMERFQNICRVSFTKYLPRYKIKYSSSIALWYLCVSVADWTRHFILYMYSEGSRFESLSEFQVPSFRGFMVLLSPTRKIPRQHFKLGKYLSLLHISNSELLNHTRLYRRRR